MADTTPQGVTQRVPVDALADLDAAPSRAAVAFAGDEGPMVVPAIVRHVDGRLHVGVDPRQLPHGPMPGRATLVVDDGQHWFELRAIVRRGTVEPAEPVEPVGGEADGARVPVRWLAFSTTSAIAWDYGRLHEEPAG